MSFMPNPAVVPDRDNLPLKKRDQRWSSAPQQHLQQQQRCDAATFKAPYPYRSHSGFKTKQPGPSRPVPKWVPALYHPWMHTHTSSGLKPQALSAFREHHGWAEWREASPLHFGWDFSHACRRRGHSSSTPAVPSGSPHHPSRFSHASLVHEGFQSVGGGFGWEHLKAESEKSLNAGRQNDGRKPYVRRRDRKREYFARVEKASPPPHPPHEDLSLQRNGLHKSTVTVSPWNTCTSTSEEASRSPILTSSVQASSSSSSPNHFPWLLPHFVAGSLIELRDGRLRRVEHLQTEDFLLGSLACPDLRLSCCTVQGIFPSASSSSSSSSSHSYSSSSRLLILLHDQQSQELVDVYDEYPFYVRGRGWSSCSPQRTARLCGLQCRQLSVGDVCLALTPVSAPRCLPSATLEPKASPGRPEEGRESLRATQPRIPLRPECPAGEEKKEAEVVRRRHYSAPELRGPGTNCM